jgi:hypothetical protein
VELNPPKDLTPTNLVGVFYLLILTFENYFIYLSKMKLYRFLMIMGIALVSISCGGASTTDETTDSTSVVLDTLSVQNPEVVVTDTTQVKQ